MVMLIFSLTMLMEWTLLIGFTITFLKLVLLGYGIIIFWYMNNFLLLIFNLGGLEWSYGVLPGTPGSFPVAPGSAGQSSSCWWWYGGHHTCLSKHLSGINTTVYLVCTSSEPLYHFLLWPLISSRPLVLLEVLLDFPNPVNILPLLWLSISYLFLYFQI